MDYIHNNPVECGLITGSTHWKYSSARNFQDDYTVLEIDSTVFLVEYLLTLAATKLELSGSLGFHVKIIAQPF